MDRRADAAPTPPVIAPTATTSAGTRAPTKACDLSMTCPTCGTLMEPEHAHYRCTRCGYRDSCCF
jgi:Zn finger protein HypA/HybF involved in hydrogenase expression